MVDDTNARTHVSPLVGSFATFTTAVNFVLGAGVLGLPFAVATAGILASAFSLLLVSFVSSLTCSWLLEVADRANAVQNSLAAPDDDDNNEAIVWHANGGVSVLPPASDFCRPTDLSEPLLNQVERRLHDYRAAYRSWRTGSHQGASDTQQRKLMRYLPYRIPYRPGVHRSLLPLHLLPRRLSARCSGPDEASEGSKLDEVNLHAVRSPSESGSGLAGAGSSHSLDTMLHRAEGDGMTIPSSIARQASFTEDLAEALLQISTTRVECEVVERRKKDEEATVGREGLQEVPQPVDHRLLPRVASPDRPALVQPDWSVPTSISALEVTQLCTLFLGWRTRTAWISSICALHVAAMWACCAIWVTCAQAATGDLPQWIPSRALLLLCAAVFLPLSALGGMEAVQPPRTLRNALPHCSPAVCLNGRLALAWSSRVPLYTARHSVHVSTDARRRISTDSCNRDSGHAHTHGGTDVLGAECRDDVRRAACL